jgi:hypothetical protein
LPNTRFEVEAAGFASTSFANFPPEQGDEPLLTLALERGAGVRVRVVDDAGQPLAGVRVEREEGGWSPAYAPVPRRDAGRQRARRWDLERRPDGDRVAVTDAGGLASFPHVHAGQQAFHVQRYRTPLDGEWTSVIVPPRGVLELGLVSLRRARLEARFVGAELACEPLSLAFAAAALDPVQLAALVDPIQPLPPGLDARTDARGGFALENLLPGRYALSARVSGQSWRYACELALREDARPFTLDLGPETLTGTVLDAEGQPVAGAWIEARLATEIETRWRRDLIDDGRLLPAVWLRERARRAPVTRERRGRPVPPGRAARAAARALGARGHAARVGAAGDRGARRGHGHAAADRAEAGRGGPARVRGGRPRWRGRARRASARQVARGALRAALRGRAGAAGVARAGDLAALCRDRARAPVASPRASAAASSASWACSKPSCGSSRSAARCSSWPANRAR